MRIEKPGGEYADRLLEPDGWPDVDEGRLYDCATVYTQTLQDLTFNAAEPWEHERSETFHGGIWSGRAAGVANAKADAYSQKFAEQQKNLVAATTWNNRVAGMVTTAKTTITENVHDAQRLIKEIENSNDPNADEDDRKVAIDNIVNTYHALNVGVVAGTSAQIPAFDTWSPSIGAMEQLLSQSLAAARPVAPLPVTSVNPPFSKIRNSGMPSGSATAPSPPGDVAGQAPVSMRGGGESAGSVTKPGPSELVVEQAQTPGVVREGGESPGSSPIPAPQPQSPLPGSVPTTPIANPSAPAPAPGSRPTTPSVGGGGSSSSSGGSSASPMGSSGGASSGASGAGASGPGSSSSNPSSGQSSPATAAAADKSAAAGSGSQTGKAPVQMPIQPPPPVATSAPVAPPTAPIDPTTASTTSAMSPAASTPAPTGGPSTGGGMSGPVAGAPAAGAPPPPPVSLGPPSTPAPAAPVPPAGAMGPGVAPAAASSSSTGGAAAAPIPVSAARSEREMMAAASKAGALRRKSGGLDPVSIAHRIGAALNAPDVVRPSDFGFFWVTAVTAEGTILVANSYGIAYIPEGINLPEQVQFVSADESVPAAQRGQWATYPIVALTGWAACHGQQLRAVIGTHAQLDRFDSGAHKVYVEDDDIPPSGKMQGRSRLEVVFPESTARLAAVSDGDLTALLPPAGADIKPPADDSQILWWEVSKPMISEDPGRVLPHLQAFQSYAAHVADRSLYSAHTAPDPLAQRAAIADWTYWLHQYDLLSEALNSG